MNNNSLISRLPNSLQSTARKFADTSEYPGPKTSVANSSPDKYLAESELNILQAVRLDNTESDSNPTKGIIETPKIRAQYQSGKSGQEFYSESVGNGPYILVSYSKSNLGGMNTVVALTDAHDSVISSGGIHLNRLYANESFVAGDLKGLPS